MGQPQSLRYKCLITLVLVLMTSSAARAGIAFVNIADDTTGRFSSLDSANINNNGQVLFSASLQTGGSGIYLGSVSGGTPATVADTLGGFSNVSGMVNNNGQVCYSASFDSGGNAIYRTTANIAAPHTRVVSGGVPFMSSPYSSVGSPHLNDSGLLAFAADLTGGPTALYAHNGTSATLVADSTGPFTPFDFVGMPINNAGQVTFAAKFDTGGYGLYRRSPGGPLVTLADTTTGPLSDFASSNVAINDAGTVAVRANSDNFVKSIYTFDGVTGAMTTYATVQLGAADKFAAVGPTLSINASGRIAFYGRANNAGARNSIFAGNDPVADLIIAEGDTLFGQPISSLSLSSNAMNSRGDIAFAYRLANGTDGIAVAVVPEPGCATLLALGTSLTLRRRRRVNTIAHGHMV